MDLVDAVALLAFALASPEPTIVFPLVFAALWFRSLYGSRTPDIGGGPAGHVCCLATVFAHPGYSKYSGT